MFVFKVNLPLALAVVILLVGTPSVSAQVDQLKDCSIWAWLTHNCAINPNGPCCHGSFRSAGESGKAWHNNKESCMDRLQETYDVCLDEDAYTRRSCDKSRREGQSFCDSVEKKQTARLSAGGATPTGGCSPWVWLTHNCAINPNGPCCHGNFRSAGKSGKAWHNDKEACLNRLEQAYDECVDDDDFTRRSCDQNRRKGVDFCGKIEQASTR